MKGLVWRVFETAHDRLQRRQRRLPCLIHCLDVLCLLHSQDNAPERLVLDVLEHAHHGLQRRQCQVQPVDVVLAERRQPHLWERNVESQQGFRGGCVRQLNCVSRSMWC